jgi:hypothetical protein
MRPLALLLGLGAGLVLGAALIGGRAAGIGGIVAVVAQTWAVLLLRPMMRAPNPQFMARWLGGMGIRFLGAGVVLIVAITNRALLPPLPAVLGYLGVLLPLLFLETRFLK